MAAKIAVLFLTLLLIAGCANMRLKEGGLDVGNDTTVGIEDVGVASVTKGF